MKNILASILMLAVTIVCSCETPSGDVVPIDDVGGSLYHAEVTSIVMPDTIAITDTLFVTLRVYTSQGAHHLSHVVLDRSTNRIAVQVFGIVTNPYILIVGSYSADIEVYPVDPGVFTVAVIQPHNSLWEETVMVVAEKPGR